MKQVMARGPSAMTLNENDSREDSQPDDDVIEIELDDESEQPRSDWGNEDDILVVELDDQDEQAGQSGANASALPAVDNVAGVNGSALPAAVGGAGGDASALPSVDDAAAEDAAVLPPVDDAALAAASAMQVSAVCAATRKPFILSVVPRPDGYEVIAAEPAPAGTSLQGAGGGTMTLQGVFHLNQYQGCPICGAKGLVLCQECGTISCAAVDGKTGQLLPCPVCGNTGPVTESKKGWAVQALGGKGKKGKQVG